MQAALRTSSQSKGGAGRPNDLPRGPGFLPLPSRSIAALHRSCICFSAASLPAMSTRRGGGAAKDRKRRQSKLAKENDISADEENEIKEAFHLFASKNAEFKDEKEGVMQTEDVRRALVALGLPPDSASELSSIISAVDPTSTGFVTYEAFVAVAAAKLHMRSDDSLAAEVDAAYRLFTKGSDGPITLQHLRLIARELKEDSVGDDLLKDMVREANGGDGLHKGVTLEQFRDVMSRAGVF